MNPNNIIFILDRTQQSENIGAAARAMANFGFSHLRLVAPKFMDRAARAARHGARVVEQSQQFKSLDDALADLCLVMGTSGRRPGPDEEVLEPVEASRELAGMSSRGKVGIVFGCESTGLTLKQLESCGRVSRIPTSAECPSMNLGQSVALYAWELRKLDFNAGKSVRGPDSPATQAQNRLVYEKLDELLKSLFYGPAGRRDGLARGLKRFLNRRAMNSRDAAYVMRLLNAAAKRR